jgi:hypothetical protein
VRALSAGALEAVAPRDIAAPIATDQIRHFATSMRTR